jgi:hypothetical protein
MRRVLHGVRSSNPVTSDVNLSSQYQRTLNQSRGQLGFLAMAIIALPFFHMPTPDCLHPLEAVPSRYLRETAIDGGIWRGAADA